MTQDIYDPAYVAGLFDRCSANYRRWSVVASFGLIHVWRRACAKALPASPAPRIIDLMAGTGEVWPHLLRRFPDATITAIDISHRMHVDALTRLHLTYSDRITHIEANALTTPLPDGIADMVVSTFGLKTFNTAQQTVLAARIAQILRPGGSFSLIEASDPKGWTLRPLYRFYLDRILPRIEAVFLQGAQDFSMIGSYTSNFGDCSHFASALRAQGLTVTQKSHVFGCATAVFGTKPIAPQDQQP